MREPWDPIVLPEHALLLIVEERLSGATGGGYIDW
jgi:hypothetical protein